MFNIGNIVDALTKAPQTQEDIRNIGAVAKYAKSPQFQAQVQDFAAQAQMFAIASLALSAIGTAVAVGSFMIDVRRSKRRGR